MGRICGLLVLLLFLSAPASGTANLPGDPALYADLGPEVLDALRQRAASGDGWRADPGAVLQAILEAAAPYRFDHPRFTVYTDRRWYYSAGSGEPGAPLMILRRWPGDTVLALYGLGGAGCSRAGESPGPEAGSFQPAEPADRGRAVCVWNGTIRGESGDYPARWVERPVPHRPFRLGALLLPGDAGLGRGHVPTMMLELQAILTRTLIHEDRWPEEPEPPASLLLPALGPPPAERSESGDPWQTALSPQLSLGLPPGIRAMRTDAGPGADRTVPGGLLWFRGRFTDRAGDPVAVGDPHRAGYVAGFVRDLDWPAADVPPVGVPGGERIAVQDFQVVRDRTGAGAATAARWKQPGFQGEWLVFRLAWPTAAVEIGLPVLTGRRSEALFWIPATLRPQGRPPAPPPLDPAERFGITFERLTGTYRKENPWVEGYLKVPGLRLEIPVGWYPVNALRTRDGFPVQLFDSGGVLMGHLERLEEGWFQRFDPSVERWEPQKRPGRFRAAAVWKRPDGAGLYRARTGGGFRLTPVQTPVGESWERMLATVQMIRPGR